MWKQNSLLGGFAESLQFEKRRKERKNGRRSDAPENCCTPCYMAAGPKCVCGCGGTHHGEGSGLTKLDSGDDVLSPSQAEPFLNQVKDFACQWCNTSLEGQPISYYTPHDGGWTVQRLSEKNLVTKTKSPNYVFYWVLWKLGVTRQ